MSTDELTPAVVPPDAAELLASEEVVLEGRMPWASNATFLVRVGDHQGIYKPVRGERPLWDFEPGLHKREVAAYRLSQAMGIGAVPPTVLREDAPLGEGSIQWFVDADHREHYFTIAEQRPDLHDQLRAIAVLDVVANNTDRKSGHCLLAPGWWDDRTSDRCGRSTTGCASRRASSCAPSSGSSPATPSRSHWSPPCCALVEAVPADIAELLDDDEVTAMQRRAAWLAEHRTLPADDSGHRYPWPLV